MQHRLILKKTTETNIRPHPMARKVELEVEGSCQEVRTVQAEKRYPKSAVFNHKAWLKNGSNMERTPFAQSPSSSSWTQSIHIQMPNTS